MRPSAKFARSGVGRHQGAGRRRSSILGADRRCCRRTGDDGHRSDADRLLDPLARHARGPRMPRLSPEAPEGVPSVAAAQLERVLPPGLSCVHGPEAGGAEDGISMAARRLPRAQQLANPGSFARLAEAAIAYADAEEDSDYERARRRLDQAAAARRCNLCGRCKRKPKSNGSQFEQLALNLCAGPENDAVAVGESRGLVKNRTQIANARSETRRAPRRPAEGDAEQDDAREACVSSGLRG